MVSSTSIVIGSKSRFSRNGTSRSSKMTFTNKTRRRRRLNWNLPEKRASTTQFSPSWYLFWKDGQCGAQQKQRIWLVQNHEWDEGNLRKLRGNYLGKKKVRRQQKKDLREQQFQESLVRWVPFLHGFYRTRVQTKGLEALRARKIVHFG